MPKGVILQVPVSLKEAERYALSDGLLCISGIDKGQVETFTIKEFLKLFFTVYNKKGSGLLTHTRVSGPEGDNQSTQCKGGKFRSIGDMYAICKYYYPDCTLLQVRSLIHELVKEKILTSWICSTINKRVFWNNTFEIPTMTNGDVNGYPYPDEFGWKYDYIPPVIPDEPKSVKIPTRYTKEAQKASMLLISKLIKQHKNEVYAKRYANVGRRSSNLR